MGESTNENLEIKKGNKQNEEKEIDSKDGSKQESFD